MTILINLMIFMINIVVKVYKCDPFPILNVQILSNMY